MNIYAYRIGASELRVPIEARESKWSVFARPFSALEPGVFVGPGPNGPEPRRVLRATLARKSRLLHERLLRDAERLPYVYALQARCADGKYRHFGSGMQTCNFNDERTWLYTGPGYCSIERVERRWVELDESRRALAEYGIESRWTSGANAHFHTLLHDLRDMQPVTIDRDRVVRAMRRRWDTHIVEKLAELTRFLNEATDEWVEVSVA